MLRDFEQWADMPFWTAEDAAILMLGRDPYVIRRLDPRMMTALIPHSPFAARLAALQERVSRFAAVLAFGNASPDKIPPSAFLMWAEKRGDALPVDLSEAIRRVEQRDGVVAPDWEANSRALEAENSELRAEIERLNRDKAIGDDGGALSGKGRNSALRLIAAMAIKKYHLKPEADYQSATTNILNDIETLGLPLKRDAIKSWLDAAIERYQEDSL
jgi:hypothetical protein